MSFITSLFELRTLDENSGWGLIRNLRNDINGSGTPAGVNVTPERALQLSAVYGAVRIIAESLASLPLIVYRRMSDGGKERFAEHPLYEILHNMPNDRMTSFQLRETMTGHLCLRGNAYAEIQSDNAGRIVALNPLNPDSVQLIKRKKEYFYLVDLPDPFSGTKAAIPFEDMLHIRGLSPDGMKGYNPIQLQRRAIGLAAATEEYGSRFFGNGAKPGGVLEHPGKMNDDGYKRLRDNWNEIHQGLENAHRVAILEEGMKYEQIGINPEDAQFLETRKFQVAEIARIFRVPPHMLGDLERATFSNIEQMSLEFVIYNLRPWLVRWEQEIYRCLLTTQERKSIFVEFLVDGLLRGDTQSRYQAYSMGRQNGWLSANDIRGLENMNPIENGDIYLVPLNMVPAEQTLTPNPSPDGRGGPLPDPPLKGRERDLTLPSDPSLPSPEGEGKSREERGKRSASTRRRLMLNYKGVIQDTAARVIRREVHDLLAGAKRNFKSRSYSDFESWMDEFFEEHRDFILKNFTETITSYASLIAAEAAEEVEFQDMTEERLTGFVRRYLQAYASRHIYTSRERVKNVLDRTNEDGSDPVDALEQEFQGWEESRPAVIAKEESVRVNGAVSQMVYSAAGWLYLTWRTFNDSCPYCKSLDGKRVGINDLFLMAGEELLPEGVESGLKVNRDIGHPPAHKGCDCMISAG